MSQNNDTTFNVNILDVHKIRRFRSMGLHFIHFGMLQVGIRPLKLKRTFTFRGKV